MADEPRFPDEWSSEAELHECWDAVRAEDPAKLDRICLRVCKSMEHQFTKLPTWLELALELGVDTL